MDYKVIASFNLRKHSVDGKFIIVLAERTCYIIFMITWCILFSKNCDVMVSSIHSRTHQVYCTRIYTDVIFICLLLVNCLCNQCSVRSHHITAKLCKDCNISHTCRNKYFFVYLAYTFTDCINIIWLLIRSVRNSDSTGKVDEFNMCSCLLFQANCFFCCFQHRRFF